ncbi:FecR domain-containing protein [Acinetobacter sp. B5B]|uniref:FecR family protein n=1 Tax=Acinetobacter baretiae TaxID=2605383 RepID=UPI0018C349A3|nr:FecR domain-containing protein [Acinetobacter baretiae]MBF7683678.1 FecR domain-containing protein [Acinetobacter baretiae]MBF7686537.1 FecR domain-containing protein [Acinetobacter baretiae]
MSQDQYPQKKIASRSVIMEQAAQWFLILDDQNCSQEESQQFQTWLKQDSSHEDCFNEIKQTFDQFSQFRQTHRRPIPHQLIENSIQKTQESSIFKKQGLYSIAIIFLVFLLWWISPTEAWFADQKNAYNTWSETKLSDHSYIKMSGNTLFNVDYNQQQRNIHLITGNILVDVAKDSRRPFFVKTDHVAIKVLGTRFIVHHFKDLTVLTMLHSSTQVDISLKNRQKKTIYVHAGQQLVIDEQGDYSIQNLSIHLAEESWKKQRLAVDLMPLDQVLNILQTYESNTLKYNPAQLHQIKVSAILPLDGSGVALLQASLPISVSDNMFNQKVISLKKE